MLSNFNAWLYGINLDNSVLRISCSELLVKQFGRDTAELMNSEQYKKVFHLMPSDMFLKKTEDEFQLRGARERNYLCITRDSAIVGFRTNYLMLDDLIRWS